MTIKETNILHEKAKANGMVAVSIALHLTAGGMVSVCLADFFNIPQTLMANCTIPHVVGM